MRAGRHIPLLAGCAVALLWPCSAALGRPHELPKWKDPNGPPVEMEVWLRRLVGQYEFDGLVHVIAQGDCGQLPPDPAQSDNPPVPPPPACESIKGKGDCVNIGTGPGVQCIFNISWRDLYNMDTEAGTITAAPGAVAYLDPSMALFGMDPAQGAISYMLVDKKGLPEGGTGINTGKRAVFLTPCVNEAVGCVRRLSIEAGEDANLLYMRVDIENDITGDPFTSIAMSMRRVRKAVPVPAGLGPSGQPGPGGAAPLPGNRRRF